jgi:hypothetical protein
MEKLENTESLIAFFQLMIFVIQSHSQYQFEFRRRLHQLYPGTIFNIHLLFSDSQLG